MKDDNILSIMPCAEIRHSPYAQAKTSDSAANIPLLQAVGMSTAGKLAFFYQPDFEVDSQFIILEGYDQKCVFLTKTPEFPVGKHSIATLSLTSTCFYR